MKKTVYFIILFWGILVGSAIGYNEHILRSGTDILLKVSPVDPRDFLRGDYVILQYDINTVSDNSFHKRDVYVVLKEQPDKTFVIQEIKTQKPKGGIFLKGEHLGRRIYYPGIKKYFVKEGTGRDLEKKLANGGIAKIAVTKNGQARIKEIITEN